MGSDNAPVEMSMEEKAEAASKTLEVEKPASAALEVSYVAFEHNRRNTETLTELLKEQDAEVVRERRKFKPGPDHGNPFRRRLLKGAGFAPNGVSNFSKDFARIVHSHSFRKLQGKSQLIPAGENEFFRTRLTHSIEVAEIGMRIAMQLVNRHNLKHNKQALAALHHTLITCSCLLHDIGHPPFGHSGEEVLNEMMAEHGGFEGNAQTLRLVTKLENRIGLLSSVESIEKEPRGLNLTVGTLSSILKYDNLIEAEQVKEATDAEGKPKLVKGYYASESDQVRGIKDILGVQPSVALRAYPKTVLDSRVVAAKNRGVLLQVQHSLRLPA